jgi:hypothetical protein
MRLIFLLFLVLASHIYSQNTLDQLDLEDLHDTYFESTITQRRFKHKDITPIIDRVQQNDLFEVTTLGHSMEGRAIRMISLGNGDTDVLLWSQMHGDESTATMAIMDLFNFFNSAAYAEEKDNLLKGVKLHFIPMLNPDGAERFQRRNLLGVDINRDALRLQSPESKILKYARDSLDADWGFNLHDQNRYYAAGQNPYTASISFLAPAYNYEKDVNQTRGDAMRLIGFINQVIQNYLPGKVGRYSDSFEPRAFGDNIQKWGSRTILVESGGLEGDREKQKLRKLHFIVLLKAIQKIADGGYKSFDISAYDEIPFNDSYMFHELIVRDAILQVNGKDYIVDVAFRQNEVSYDDSYQFFLDGSISDIGDLSTSFGYEELDAKGLRLTQGRIYPQVITTKRELDQLNFQNLLREGFTTVMTSFSMPPWESTKFPLQLISAGQFPETSVTVGSNPALILKNGEMIVAAVVNGGLIQVKEVRK